MTDFIQSLCLLGLTVMVIRQISYNINSRKLITIVLDDITKLLKSIKDGNVKTTHSLDQILGEIKDKLGEVK